MEKSKIIIKKRDFWNLIFILIFMGIFIFEVSYIKYFDFDFEFLEIVIFSLALFRLTRLIVFDTITQFFRDRFLKLEFKEDGSISREKYQYGFKRSISDILGCPWCSSIWIALFLFPLFWLFPDGVLILVVIMAVSGIAVFFLFIVNLIGNVISLINLKVENEKQKLKNKR